MKRIFGLAASAVAADKTTSPSGHWEWQSVPQFGPRANAPIPFALTRSTTLRPSQVLWLSQSGQSYKRGKLATELIDQWLQLAQRAIPHLRRCQQLFQCQVRQSSVKPYAGPFS